MILLSAHLIELSVHHDDDKKITLNGPKILVNSCVILCFFRSKLFSIAVRFSAEILSPYGGFPSQSVFLEFVVPS